MLHNHQTIKPLMRRVSHCYYDNEVVEWFKFGLLISYDPSAKITLESHATQKQLTNTSQKRSIRELPWGLLIHHHSCHACLTSRPKKDSSECWIILGHQLLIKRFCEWPHRQTTLCVYHMSLPYIEVVSSTMDTMAQRIIQQEPLDYSLIGMRWCNKLYFDKSMPMGLRSAVFCC